MDRLVGECVVDGARRMGNGQRHPPGPLRPAFLEHASGRHRVRRAGRAQRRLAAMTVTLSDVERWDPEAIRAVFDAAIQRAHGTRTASAALTETMRLANFGGDTAEAAQEATHATT